MKGTIRVIDVTDINNPTLIMIKKINIEKSVYKIQVSHDGTMIAILNKNARRVIFITTDFQEEFKFIGYAKLPGVCLDISWASAVKPPINSSQSNKCLEVVVKNGLLVAVVPPIKVKFNRQLEELTNSEITMFGRKIDFDIEKLTVGQTTGDVFCTGSDRL